MSLIRHLSTDSSRFDTELDRLLARQSDAGSDETGVLERVRSILSDVRRRGDEALLEYTARFDRLELRHGAALEIPEERMRASLNRISESERDALNNAGQRLKAYAERQRLESWTMEDEFGNRLGQTVRPLDRVGIYVPGGKAAYPSSVLMNAVPAKVAGVTEVVMVVPTPDGEVNDLVLAAAAIAGVDRIFTLGGAQAVAALTYGTESVPAVDKIAGPGNIYVATAKRLVFGTVGIDMIAGPSEVAIVADMSAEPEWLAMDLFAQAEHDEQAQSILVSPDGEVLRAVEEAIERLLPGRPRESIIRQSLADRGALIRVADMAEAISVINRIAPEHLELAVETPSDLMGDVRHAGAVFMGHYSPEAFGDYCAGPNHVLPTSGSARFSSPLGVYDFQKRTSVIDCVPGGVSRLADTAETLARGEGLAAHADSAALRRGS